MFEQSMIPKVRRSPWTTVVAILGQVSAVGLMILIPLVYVDALPAPDLVSMLVAPPPPPPPPPPAAPPVHAVRRVAPRHFDLNALVAPKTIPKQIAMIKDAPADVAAPNAGVVGGVAGGVAGGQPGGVLGSILSAVPSPAPPPPPPPPAAAAVAPAPKPDTPQTIHVGGNVEAAQLLNAPQPAYPAIAKQARVQGLVELKAIIGTDGKIQDLTVVSGNPLLVNAAMSAVRNWVYRPTYLNGKAVQVATEIDVHFQLG